MAGMKITVYDKDRVFAAQVGAPLKLTVTPRVYPLIGTALMVLPLRNAGSEADQQAHAGMIAALRDEGARVVFTKRGHTKPDLSGVVDEATIDTEADTLEVLVLDDTYILGGILGWQAPSRSILEQHVGEYGTYSGPAETVVKNAVRENGVNRLGIPGLIVAPDLGRGTEIPGGTSYRMHPLPDRIYPGLDLAGIGVTVKQIGADLVFDTYVPREYPVTLSVEGRTVKKAVWTRGRPTASRAVIGGRGEGRERDFRTVTDAAREAAYGFLGEVFVDARDVGDTWAQLKQDITKAIEDEAKADPGAEKDAATAARQALEAQEPAAHATYIAEMIDRGNLALLDARAKDNLSITLAESSAFSYGEDGVLVGDKVRVRVHRTVITDVVTEAVLEWVSPNYVSAEPIIGEQVDSTTRTQQQLQALKESQRREERS